MTRKEGDICFWRQDREQIVHLISNPDVGDKLLIVACNTAGEDFMFATKSEQGVIRVWKVTDTLPSFREQAIFTLQEMPSERLDD